MKAKFDDKINAYVVVVDHRIVILKSVNYADAVREVNEMRSR